MFASQSIRSGEIVCIKGGHILRRSEIYSSGSINSYLPLDDEFYLGAINEDEEPLVKLVINHSCSPNCGMRGEITIVAMRDIQVDEELTIDYAEVPEAETAKSLLGWHVSQQSQCSVLSTLRMHVWNGL